MKKFFITPREVFNDAGSSVGIATEVNMRVQFYAGDATAIGYYEFLSTGGDVLRRGNKTLSAEGWGVDDTIMFNRLAEAITATIVE